ncbi:MAG: zinc metallopeptidase [Fusicatenibacter sp.]|nr:zinc metallopeptidase [Lachnospiraceae bacterium]MDY2938766.1 zinc metallopeptidase [Fusicatenibacter sp.]
MLYGFMDWTYVLVVIAALISALVSARMNSVFGRYQKVRSACQLTGRETALRILHLAGIYDVTVQHVSGNLTDHYDPRTKTLNLSDSVYNSTSLAAVGVAAHECGHAIQHDVGYVPLKIRSAIVPVANFGSQLFWPLFLLGLIMSLPALVKAGIWLFVFALAFQIVTLPVEFNASRRAVAMLTENGIVREEEKAGVKKVLTAAAMTYVAAVIGSLLQLLRLLILSGAFRRNDD